MENELSPALKRRLAGGLLPAAAVEEESEVSKLKGPDGVPLDEFLDEQAKEAARRARRKTGLKRF